MTARPFRPTRRFGKSLAGPLADAAVHATATRIRARRHTRAPTLPPLYPSTPYLASSFGITEREINTSPDGSVCSRKRSVGAVMSSFCLRRGPPPRKKAGSKQRAGEQEQTVRGKAQGRTRQRKEEMGMGRLRGGWASCAHSRTVRAGSRMAATCGSAARACPRRWAPRSSRSPRAPRARSCPRHRPRAAAAASHQSP